MTIMEDWLDWIKAHKWLIVCGAIGVVIAFFFFVNRTSDQSSDTVSLLSQRTSSSKTAGSNSSTSSISNLVVDVKGAVQKPGVYSLPAGSRVTDAIKMAGGFAPTANQRSVNLAQKLEDEAVIYVAAEGEPFVEGEGVDSTLSSDSGGQATSQDKVNLNTATAQELQTIPSIGEKRAQDIIAYREENGGFRSIDELKNISGIGEKTFEKIKEEVTI